MDVIPLPKQVTFGTGAFEIDHYCIVLVASKATRGTRRAARAIQLGIRERFGTDVQIVRIAEQTKHGVTRPIWVVEPRLGRSPAKTIGVKGLKFSDEMSPGGYFVRVDAVEAVVHGADATGSYYGAQTLLQLIRPPQRASLFRKGRGPTIPCLWIRDWPSHPVRAIPQDVRLPAEPWAAEGLLKLAARYKLNAVAEAAFPADAAVAGRIRRLAAERYIRTLERVPALADTPRASPPAAWAEGAAAAHYALAAQAELAWGPPGPDLFARTFHRRFAAAEAQHHALAESALRKRRDEERRKRELKEREEEKAAEGETSSN